MKLIRLMFVAGALAACDTGNGVTGPIGEDPLGSYRGVLVGPGVSAALAFTVEDAAARRAGGAAGPLLAAASAPGGATPVLVSGAVVARGSISPAGAGSAIAIAGQFEANGELTMTGGGYALSSTYSSGGTFSGTFTGPNGGGAFVAAAAKGGAVVLYCGAYTASKPGAAPTSGPFDFLVKGTAALGVYINRFATSGRLTGAASGATLTLTDPADAGFSAPGTVSGSSVSGTITAGDGISGTYTASTCG